MASARKQKITIGKTKPSSLRLLPSAPRVPQQKTNSKKGILNDDPMEYSDFNYDIRQLTPSVLEMGKSSGAGGRKRK